MKFLKYLMILVLIIQSQSIMAMKALAKKQNDVAVQNEMRKNTEAFEEWRKKKAEKEREAVKLYQETHGVKLEKEEERTKERSKNEPKSKEYESFERKYITISNAANIELGEKFHTLTALLSEVKKLSQKDPSTDFAPLIELIQKQRYETLNAQSNKIPTNIRYGLITPKQGENKLAEVLSQAQALLDEKLPPYLRVQVTGLIEMIEYYALANRYKQLSSDITSKTIETDLRKLLVEVQEMLTNYRKAHEPSETSPHKLIELGLMELIKSIQQNRYEMLDTEYRLVSMARTLHDDDNRNKLTPFLSQAQAFLLEENLPPTLTNPVVGLIQRIQRSIYIVLSDLYTSLTNSYDQSKADSLKKDVEDLSKNPNISPYLQRDLNTLIEKISALS